VERCSGVTPRPRASACGTSFPADCHPPPHPLGGHTCRKIPQISRRPGVSDQRSSTPQESNSEVNKNSDLRTFKPPFRCDEMNRDRVRFRIGKNDFQPPVPHFLFDLIGKNATDPLTVRRGTNGRFDQIDIQARKNADIAQFFRTRPRRKTPYLTLQRLPRRNAIMRCKTFGNQGPFRVTLSRLERRQFRFP
jgi:hypothetical protein